MSVSVAERNAAEALVLLSKQPRSVLKSWLLAHLDYPCPTDYELDWLSAATGWSVDRIEQWLLDAIDVYNSTRTQRLYSCMP